MISFRNGVVAPNEMVDVQGKGVMPAKDVPVGSFCWKIGNRQYFGIFEKCLWEKV